MRWVVLLGGGGRRILRAAARIVVGRIVRAGISSPVVKEGDLIRVLLDCGSSVGNRDAARHGVTLELVNGLSPIVMNPCDGSGRYSYMVLPVRLKAGE